jgi:hypothetical protein
MLKEVLCSYAHLKSQTAILDPMASTRGGGFSEKITQLQEEVGGKNVKKLDMLPENSWLRF